MIAVHFLTAQRYRVFAPETATIDVPEDFERRGGAATESSDGATLVYLDRNGGQSTSGIAATKLAFRRATEICLVRSDEKDDEGRALWMMARVEGRL